MLSGREGCSRIQEYLLVRDDVKVRGAENKLLTSRKGMQVLDV